MGLHKTYSIKTFSGIPPSPPSQYIPSPLPSVSALPSPFFYHLYSEHNGLSEIFPKFSIILNISHLGKKNLAKKLQITEGGVDEDKIKPHFWKVSGKDGQQKWYTDSGIRPSSKCFNIIPFILYLVHLGENMIYTFCMLE